MLDHFVIFLRNLSGVSYITDIKYKRFLQSYDTFCSKDRQREMILMMMW